MPIHEDLGLLPFSVGGHAVTAKTWLSGNSGMMIFGQLSLQSRREGKITLTMIQNRSDDHSSFSRDEMFPGATSNDPVSAANKSFLAIFQDEMQQQCAGENQDGRTGAGYRHHSVVNGAGNLRERKVSEGRG